MPELNSLIHDSPERLTVVLNDRKVDKMMGYEPVEVVVDYHPARITPLWLSNAMQTDDPLSLARSLAAVMSGWDVVENGQTVPLTPETLATFPFPVLGAFADAIGQAAAGSAEGNDTSTSPRNGAPASMTPSTTAENQSSLVTSRQHATET